MSLEKVTYALFQQKNLFIPFRYVYPECLKLLEPHDQTFPLLCLRSDHCPGNKNCMGTLTHRLNYLFSQVEPDVELIVAYFKWRDRPSIRAGIFHRDMRVPRLVIVNPTALKKFLNEGEQKIWFPKNEYWMTQARPDIIPAESLTQLVRKEKK